MNLNEYQIEAAKFAQFPHDPLLGYITIAIMGEAGEVANVYKKELRSGIIQTDKIRDELSDIWWYLAALCTEYSVELQKLYDIVEQRPGTREPDQLKQHLRDLIKEALDLDSYNDRWSRNSERDKSIFLFAKDVLREVLWIQWYYELSNEEVLSYNLYKLNGRLATGTIKEHD